jgi:hypothetical protein
MIRLYCLSRGRCHRLARPGGWKPHSSILQPHHGRRADEGRVSYRGRGHRSAGHQAVSAGVRPQSGQALRTGNRGLPPGTARSAQHQCCHGHDASCQPHRKPQRNRSSELAAITRGERPRQFELHDFEELAIQAFDQRDESRYRSSMGCRPAIFKIDLIKLYSMLIRLTPKATSCAGRDVRESSDDRSVSADCPSCVCQSQKLATRLPPRGQPATPTSRSQRIPIQIQPAVLSV